MLEQKTKTEIENNLRLINKLTYCSDRVEKAAQLKTKLIAEFNDEIDSLFEILNLKKTIEEINEIK